MNWLKRLVAKNELLELEDRKFQVECLKDMLTTCCFCHEEFGSDKALKEHSAHCQAHPMWALLESYKNDFQKPQDELATVKALHDECLKTLVDCKNRLLATEEELAKYKPDPMKTILRPGAYAARLRHDEHGDCRVVFEHCVSKSDVKERLPLLRTYRLLDIKMVDENGSTV